MRLPDPRWATCLPYIKSFLRSVETTAAIKSAEGATNPHKAAIDEELSRLEKYVICLNGGATPSPREVPAEPVTMSLGQLINPTRVKSERWKRDRRLIGYMRHVVYVVRDGDTVLYVGITAHGARKRLKAHISSGSILGSAIRRNPESAQWLVEMIAMPDNRTALQKEKELARLYRPKYCLKT